MVVLPEPDGPTMNIVSLDERKSETSLRTVKVGSGHCSTRARQNAWKVRLHEEEIFRENFSRDTDEGGW